MRDIGPIDSIDDIEEIGNELSRALFQDQVMSAYAESKGIVAGKEAGRWFTTAASNPPHNLSGGLRVVEEV